MNKLEQAARQLLSVLENGMIDINAVAALREALAEQAEQEPVACIIHTEEGDYLDWNSKGYCFYVDETPLYAAPVRTVDMTDDEISKLRHKIDWTAEWSYVNFARDVIAADREKNK